MHFEVKVLICCHHEYTAQVRAESAVHRTAHEAIAAGQVPYSLSPGMRYKAQFTVQTRCVPDDIPYRAHFILSHHHCLQSGSKLHTSSSLNSVRVKSCKDERHKTFHTSVFIFIFTSRRRYQNETWRYECLAYSSCLMQEMASPSSLWTLRLACITYIRSYRAVNTFRLGYKNQSVNAVQWNNRCLFWDPYEAHKCYVWEECTVFIHQTWRYIQ
jgi:hypothetical protein